MSAPTLLFSAFSLLLLAVNHGRVSDIITFARANETASHVILVPFVTIVLLYQNRRAILDSVEWSPKAGALIVIAGLLTPLVGRTLGGGADRISVEVAGLVIVWVGGFLFCYGTAAMQAAMFPLAFLAFAIPLPHSILDSATHALRLGSSTLVAHLFSLTGTPFFREEFVFTLPGVVIEVAQECSGIRSSIALLLTGSLACHTFLTRWWTRALFVACIVPVAMLKNAVRISSLSLLAIHVDPGFLTGQLHHEGGFVFFLLGLAMLAPVLALLRRSEHNRGVAMARAASESYP